ncbi:MAG TPA: 50S ribosomal protein L11 methyltransferase [Chthoniobacteraceae bacterium]|nr:50S ribosomal protein L11 methyltransferase [Chthoniobacteraceae bacterium]
MFAWRKLASAKWEDAWVERLAFLGPTRVVITALPNRRSLRIEAFGLTKKEAQAVVQQFGGDMKPMKSIALPPPAPRKPLVIRDRLLIVDPQTPLPPAAAARSVITIPAAMAFGTGEHATTASCLRLLCDLARIHEKAGAPWDFLDLGTGSGILAIAARRLGASHAEGCDFDPHAVRTAKENVAANRAEPLPIHRRDVLKWTPKRTWEVVAANLFSEVLIAAAPTLAAAVRPGGHLLLSGILRTQEAEVVATFTARGFVFLKTVRKGKWVTLLAVLPQKDRPDAQNTLTRPVRRR